MSEEKLVKTSKKVAKAEVENESQPKANNRMVKVRLLKNRINLDHAICSKPLVTIIDEKTALWNEERGNLQIIGPA